MTGLSIKTLLSALRKAEYRKGICYGFSNGEGKWKKKADLFEKKIIEKCKLSYHKGFARAVEISNTRMEFVRK